MSSEKTTVLTKDTITRLLRDVKGIMKNPLTENGIYYIHDDDDILKGYALIIGPSETPYFSGNYFFEINYPANYPHSPPHVTYCTNGDNIRFNPNLYKCGKVCVSILNTWRGEQWTSCQTISTLLLTLCTLLCENPLLNEPGVTKTHPDFANYTKIIEYKNVEIAILKMINKIPGVYPEKFNIFYSMVKDNFIKNKDVILKHLEDRSRENPQVEQINTSIYNMNVQLNYPKLLKSFKNACEVIT
jgi:ubiquitin-protein ligase